METVDGAGILTRVQGLHESYPGRGLVGLDLLDPSPKPSLNPLWCRDQTG